MTRSSILLSTSLALFVFSFSDELKAESKSYPANASFTEAAVSSSKSPQGSAESDAFRARLQGIARPKQEAFMRFATQGHVMQLHVAEGQTVKRDTPLVSLDDRVQQSEVNAARAASLASGELLQARAEMERTKAQLRNTQDAFAANASSEFELASKKNAFDQAAAALQQAEENREVLRIEYELSEAKHDLMTLRAPFDGQVVKLGVKQGNTVSIDEDAVHIADLSELEVELHLPSTMFGSVSTGDQVDLRAGKPVSRTLTADVVFASSMIEPISGTFRVKLAIRNSNLSLPAGFEVWFQ